ncbi:hypothetical protein IX39_00220 [Chryseobacterium formosense]|uniref:Uncharacterized protein n=1 Tax=Chryseobacterium formosense TaxID=236814 RepID=A0A085Z3Z1_9FLAO|nr:hypothetical protein [Chryseobacterium formosense]KFE99154.1 hypothetical protein IX39_00220 [Chryseobacterium formosense]SFT76973.1 hypothetical protein SAMN05421857_3215 [Chryseobacterium formosense]
MINKVVILLVLTFFISNSCNKNKKVLNEDYINLYPDKKIIKKQYYRYSTFDPFFPNDSLYSPIESSKNFPDRAKTLVNQLNFYDLRNFNAYINKNMGGEYNAYIYENNTPLYRIYLKIYKENDKRELSTNKEIENYFKQNKIGYKFLKNKPDNLSNYLLEMKNTKDSAFCVINSEVDLLKIYLTYNVKDTIRSLPTTAIRPFLGDVIEN